MLNPKLWLALKCPIVSLTGFVDIALLPSVSVLLNRKLQKTSTHGPKEEIGS